jgi:hypothetical protein
MNTKKSGKSTPFSKSKPQSKSHKTSNPFKGKPSAKSPVESAEGKPTTENKEKPTENKKYFPPRFKEKKGDPMPKFNEDEIRLNKFF